MKYQQLSRPLQITIYLVMCILLFPHTLRAHDVLVDGIYYNINSGNNTASVTFEGRTAPSKLCNTYEGVVTIPETFTYNNKVYTVTEIGANAFNLCWKLTDISLPNSIQTIGSCAFEYTSSLKKIVLPEGVKEIAYRAFFTSYMEEIVLPSTLQRIGNEAFCFNKNLKSISIPAATTNISIGFNREDGYCNPFGYNDSLTAIIVDADNPDFSSKDGILYNKSQTTLCAFPSGITGKVMMPNTIAMICYGAFTDSKATVLFDNGLQSIESFAFASSKGTFCFKSLPKYDKYVWSNMSDATVYVPADHVSSVKKYCEGKVYPLPVDFPYWVEIKPYIKGLTLSLEDNPFYEGETDEISEVVMTNNPELIAQHNPADNTYKFLGLQPNCQYKITLATTSGKTMVYEAATLPANVKQPKVFPYMAGMKIWDITADTDETAIIRKTGAVVYGDALINGSVSLQKVFYTFSKDTLTCDLYPGTSYTITPFVVYEGEDSTMVYGDNAYATTNDITMHTASHVKSTQRTLTFKLGNMYKTDETVKVEEFGILKDNKYVPFDEQGIAVLTGLNYNTKHFVYLYIKYNGGKIRKVNGLTVYTLDVKPDIKVTQTSSSLFIEPDTTGVGDAGLLSWSLYYNDQDLGQDSLFLRGLSPQQSINIRLIFRMQGGGTKIAYFTPSTLPLEFSMMTPKCITATSAIVAAKTNIDPQEINVGFQWRKYDAPETMESKEAYTILEDGKIEGIIKNLQTSAYYNVRAFYQADNGSRHYGDWVTFDPSDYSYFEPTIRTYEAVEVGFNSAKVKAYVLAGTDEIIEQGFEYWLSSTAHSKAIRMEVVPRANEDVNTVLGTGQVMVVTLTDLQPNSEYTFCSFVKTASGTTYGEEQTLITESDPTGIENAEYNVPSSVITGYYDLEGRKHNELKKGLNIIRYSDGSVRKVLVE